MGSERESRDLGCFANGGGHALLLHGVAPLLSNMLSYSSTNTTEINKKFNYISTKSLAMFIK